MNLQHRELDKALKKVAPPLGLLMPELEQILTCLETVTVLKISRTYSQDQLTSHISPLVNGLTEYFEIFCTVFFEPF